MNPQQMRRARLIPIDTLQHPLDEALFEFSDGFIE